MVPDVARIAARPLAAPVRDVGTASSARPARLERGHGRGVAELGMN